MVNPEFLGTLLGTATIVGVKQLFDWRGGRRRDRTHRQTIEDQFSELNLELERRFNGVTSEIVEARAEVKEVRGFVVGPDGENGIRGELRAFKREVIKRLEGLEGRELERLERDRLHGPYEPRRS